MDNTTKTAIFLLATGLVIGGAAAFDPVTSTISALSCSAMTAHLNPSCLAETALDGIQADTEEEAHREAYQSALILEDERERKITESNSNYDHTHGLAASRGKLAVWENLENGSSQSEATTDATAAINDIYSAKQRRLIEAQSNEALEFEANIVEDINNLNGLTVSDVFNTTEKLHEQHEDIDEGYTLNSVDFTFDNKSVQLFNGTETDIEIARIELEISNPDGNHAGNLLYNYGQYWADMNSGFNSIALKATHPTNSNETTALNGTSWNQTWSNLEEDRNRAIDNVATYTGDIYSNYDAGDISVNISEMFGPLEQLHLASTNYEDTGHYAWLALQSEQAGYASNKSHAFKVKFNNQDMAEKTRTGQLFVPDGFNNTLEVGKEYDASNHTVWFVYQTESGDADKIDLDGTFEIMEMTDKSTGEQINTTVLQDTEIYTESTDDLEQQLEQLKETQAYLENLSVGGGIGDGVSDWLDSIDFEKIATYALATVVVGFFAVMAI